MCFWKGITIPSLCSPVWRRSLLGWPGSSDPEWPSRESEVLTHSSGGGARTPRLGGGAGKAVLQRAEAKWNGWDKKPSEDRGGEARPRESLESVLGHSEQLCARPETGSCCQMHSMFQ